MQRQRYSGAAVWHSLGREATAGAVERLALQGTTRERQALRLTAAGTDVGQLPVNIC